MNKFRITKPCYTMEVADDSAELVMYGEIVETQPIDQWTGEPVSGAYIKQDEFLEDLKAIENAKNLTIRMNSVGGDAIVSIAIHNRLRDLANQGKKINCIVDGVAMSGGSLIMCACDNVKVNPSSLIMIHKAWSYIYGGYNADELRALAEQSDAYDKSQVAIYKRKCGLSETVLMHMMADTTYMTGKEAVEKGFADELIEGETLKIEASADGRSIICNGRAMHLAPGMFAPDSIPTTKVQSNAKEKEKGGKKTMNVEELKASYPELVKEIENKVLENADTMCKKAVIAERKRLQEIDEVAQLFSADMVKEARYGETACNAQELSYRAAKKASMQGSAFLNALAMDAQNSGVFSVSAAPAKVIETEKSDSNLDAEKIKELLK